VVAVHNYVGWRTRRLELTVHRYLFRARRRPRLSPLLEALVLDTAELREIMNCRCPFCGKQFRGRRDLAVHLALDRRCKFHYGSLLKYVASTYRAVRAVIRRDNRRYYVKGYNWYLTDPLDACRAAISVLRV